MIDLAAQQAEGPDADEEDEKATIPELPAAGSLQASTTGELPHPGAAARTTSPGSGVYTPRRSSRNDIPGTPGSWRSAAPGTPGGLEQRINKTFDPLTESLQHYENRLRRQAHALESIGQAVPASRIDVLLTKARIISNYPERGVLKHLKREYAMGLLEEDSEEAALSTQALEELLLEQEFDPSEVRGCILSGDAARHPRREMIDRCLSDRR